MTWIQCLVFMVLTFQWTLTRADTEESCVFMESCILPCSYKTGADVVIHWIQEPTGNHVHSYYHNQDQLSHQDQHFKGRTSLFKDQISRGNASLQLTGVKIQDQGRYKCYTSTVTGNKESFINLKVDAPVNKVEIHQVENSITCSSEGIYPEPELTWSTNPHSNMTFNTPTIQQTKQQLHSISSSLIHSDPGSDVVYSCTISTRRNNGTATLFVSNQLTKVHGRGRVPAAAAAAAVLTAAVLTAAVLALYFKKKATNRQAEEDYSGCPQAHSAHQQLQWCSHLTLPDVRLALPLIVKIRRAR